MVFVAYEAPTKRLAVQLGIQGFDLTAINEQLGKNISMDSLRRWTYQFNTTGDVLVNPEDYDQAGPPSSLQASEIESMRAIITAKPSIYLDELQEEVKVITGIEVSVPTIRRYVHGLGLTLKKSRSVHPGRSLESQGVYIGEVAGLPPSYLVFADESAICAELCYRPRSWAPRGLRTTRVSMRRARCRFSILPAVSIKGVEALMVQQGPITRLDFEFFLEHRLLPVMLPYPAAKSVLVIDNAQIHRHGRIPTLCKDRGVKLLYLPPYTPSFNPIEKAFSVLKNAFRRIGGLSGDARDGVRIRLVALQVLTAPLMRKLYRTCGYF